MPMTPQETGAALYELEQIKQTKARYFRFLDTKQWADWPPASPTSDSWGRTLNPWPPRPMSCGTSPSS